jgi:hypothetical protein
MLDPATLLLLLLLAMLSSMMLTFPTLVYPPMEGIKKIPDLGCCCLFFLNGHDAAMK